MDRVSPTEGRRPVAAVPAGEPRGHRPLLGRSGRIVLRSVPQPARLSGPQHGTGDAIETALHLPAVRRPSRRRVWRDPGAPVRRGHAHRTQRLHGRLNRAGQRPDPGDPQRRRVRAGPGAEHRGLARRALTVAKDGFPQARIEQGFSIADWVRAASGGRTLILCSLRCFG